MADGLYFPRLLLREKSHSWNLAGTAASPGQTALNVVTVMRSDGGGYWICNLTDVSLGARGTGANRTRQRNATLLWRAVRQLANGGASLMVVPRNDALFRPWPAGVALAEVETPHSDLTLFSDGTGYEQSVIDIVANAADLRATSLSITINKAGTLLGGESFSIRHGNLSWRLYEIGSVVYTDASHAVISFNPPLREAILAGTQLEFDRPRCTMRLTAPGAMDLSVTPWTFNSASGQFVEAFA
jgi:hypothetical protein